MVISTFLKFGMVKLFKNLHSVVDLSTLLIQIKIFEKINIVLFLIHILIQN